MVEDVRLDRVSRIDWLVGPVHSWACKEPRGILRLYYAYADARRVLSFARLCFLLRAVGSLLVLGHITIRVKG